MARTRRGTLSQIDRFAEALANTAWTERDGSVPFAGAQLGLDTRAANDVMQRLKRAVGWQAR